MKKNAAVVNPVTVDQNVTRQIKKSKEERELKITQYLDAAIYNCKKIGNAKLQAEIEKIRKTC